MELPASPVDCKKVYVIADDLSAVSCTNLITRECHLKNQQSPKNDRFLRRALDCVKREEYDARPCENVAQVMASFDKALVDVAELSDDELDRVTAELGVPGYFEKFCNGGCAANYGSEVAVIKAIVGPDAAMLAENLVTVLRAVSATGVGPKVLSEAHATCATTRGKPACAIAMTRAPGRALNVLVREGALDSVTGYGALGGALGQLHASAAHAATQLVGDSRFIERFVRIERSVEAELEPYRGDAFVDWLAMDDWKRLDSARACLSNNSLPAGLLHGDPYADNAVAVVQDGAIKSIQLVDWEDACYGPYCYDLASALVATVFNIDTQFDASIASSILGQYAQSRSAFCPDEATAIPAFMRANAIACALYRWHQFHVCHPSAPPAARDAYLEMQVIAAALEDRTLRSRIVSIAIDEIFLVSSEPA